MFRIDKEKADRVLRENKITAEWLAQSMELPLCDMQQMIAGNLELDITDCRKLLSIIGYKNFAQIARDKVIRRVATDIARGGKDATTHKG